MVKTLDSKGRWRNKSVAFRMSPEEAEQLNHFSRLSGLTKQEYLIKRALQKDITVKGNPRVYKALHELFNEVLDELRRLEDVSEENVDLLELISYMASIMEGLKGDLDG
jgi:hypothetical protein